MRIVGCEVVTTPQVFAVAADPPGAEMSRRISVVRRRWFRAAAFAGAAGALSLVGLVEPVAAGSM